MTVISFRTLFGGLAVLAVLAAPLTALSQETAVVEARAIFHLAKDHYEKGRYAKALAELERAYEIKKLTVFLRYMGDCNMKLARYEQALSIYTQYLRKKPDAEDGEVVKAEMALALERLRAQRKAEYKGKTLPVELRPTGKDQEDPVLKLPQTDTAEPPPDLPGVPVEPGEPMTTLGVAKWTSGGLSLVAMALGITFNRLAVAKSDELLNAVRQACPEASGGSCSGNPGLNNPIAPYNKEHLQLELEVEQFNELAVASFVVGGAAAAASVTLFVLDWLGKRERRGAGRRVTIAPLLDGESALLFGEVTF